MAQIELDPQEAAALVDVLDSVLSDLRMEIANTDSSAYREQLKRRVEILKKVLAQLGKS